MTEAYRQKLLNWLTSMGVLILVTNLCLASYWFFNRPVGWIRTYDLDGNRIGPEGWSLIDWAGPMSGNLGVFVVGFLVFAAWHLLDLIQRRPASEYPATLMSGYNGFVSTVMFHGLMQAFRVSGRFEFTECARNADGEIVFGFDGCRTYIVPWLEWATGIAMLLLVVLVIGKGIIAIRSLFQKVS